VYGGSEANVSVSLCHFGMEALHVTRFPENELGIAATQTLRSYGVDTNNIIFGEERMGLYFLENGSIHRPSRIIYDRFDSAFAHIKKGMIDWDSIMQEASWFHWSGITPAISQGAADVCYEAVVAARKNNVPVSGDINYRRNLWQYGKKVLDVMPSLIAHCDYIVGGEADFENCLDIKESNYEKACEQVRRKCRA